MGEFSGPMGIVGAIAAIALITLVVGAIALGAWLF